MYGALLHGGRLVVVPKETTKDTISFRDLILEEGVTVLNQTPSSFYTLQEEFLRESIETSSIRYVIFGGEALNPTYLASWNKLYTDCKLVNMYGITETTVHVTYKEIRESDISNSVSTIGCAIPTLSCYILDDHLNLVPQGVIGELCVGGSGVARGYLNREELTKEKFISNPFEEEASSRLYKSGDLGRWLADGTIEYIGRKDDQVKIRGYRIELGEIENVLLSIATVSHCCVLAKEDINGNKRLVGYVVSEETFDKDDLQKELKVSLPDYMVPMLWVEMEEMPLTSNGKLDRKSLPDPEGSDLSTKEYIGPRNETEAQLVAIWEELLGLDKIGIYDNFFELGGHSLLVTQLISRLQKIDLHIGVKDIFSSPSIAAISEKLSSSGSIYEVPANGITLDISHITPSMVPLLKFNQEDLNKVVENIEGGVSNIQDMYPLSPLQEGMYFHYLMSEKEEGDPYVLPSLLSFPDKSKRASFIEALQFVVDRHDVLRTCIISEGLPHAVQVVLKEAPLSVEELTIAPSLDILSELELLSSPGNQWLDVSKAPLLTLKSVDDQEKENYYLQINQHHLVLDHVGMEKIISEITIYLSGEESKLGVPVLYRDFIGHTLHLQLINDSETYFAELLGDVNEPTYPFDLSDVRGTGSSIEETKIVLPKELSKNLRNVCAKLGISPAVLFHAAYGIVIGKCSNKDYAIFGSLFSGRLQGSLGAADSLGLFINTLPIFIELKGTAIAYLNEVKKRLEELMAYEQTSLSNIQSWSGVSNEVSLFSSLLNYRHSSTPFEVEETIDSTDFGFNIINSHERTNYPFSLDVDDFGLDFVLTAQIDGDIESNQVLLLMQEVLEELLESLITEDLSPITSLEVLP
ncbi:AMP-binding protein, partial [Tenacibaculum sp.]|nr:AMP-binding protein [Tenacibaculum sp.]